jgi:hypothetical protein
MRDLKESTLFHFVLVHGYAPHKKCTGIGFFAPRSNGKYDVNNQVFIKEGSQDATLDTEVSPVTSL